MSSVIKALVVDDDENDLRLHSDILRAEGYAVQTASNGVDACELIAKETFDLIVTDIVMRPVSGFEVLQAARRADPDTISIAMTSHGSGDSAADALSFGAYSYLLKPCDEQALRHCMLKGLEKQGLVKELRLRNKELEGSNRELDARVQAATADLHALNHRMLTEMASLREVDELKTAFLNNVSHDLKSPLTTIKGYLAILLKEEGSEELSEDVERKLQLVLTATSHMEYLVSQILEAAKLTSGTVRLDFAALSVADIVAECAGAARVQADAAGIELEVRSEPLTVTADRGRVLQILGNLLGNACKFTPRGGKISLVAEKIDDGVRFCVSDTGPGIAPVHLPRIFERFYQVDGSLAKAKGLGLGLRIVTDLVKLHGGKIWAESKVGQGSRFYVELPLVPPPAPAD